MRSQKSLSFPLSCSCCPLRSPWPSRSPRPRSRAEAGHGSGTSASASCARAASASARSAVALRVADRRREGRLQSGKVLFTDGDYAGSLVKFSSAFDVSKDPRLLWNMAACEKNLRHYAKALKLVRQYVADGDKVLADQDKQEAGELIKVMEPFTAKLKVTVDEPDAEVRRRRRRGSASRPSSRSSSTSARASCASTRTSSKTSRRSSPSAAPRRSRST